MKSNSCSTSMAQRVHGCLLIALLGLGCQACNRDMPLSARVPEPPVTFKPQEMADALHAVIAADRRIYSIQITEPSTREGGDATASVSAAHELPLPSKMLRLASEEVQKNGAEFHYVLRSLWPLDPRHAAETATENAGLEFVVSRPETNYYCEESLGGRRYLTAVYPDVAISSTCVDCHNRRSGSGRHKFKQGDVMGGIVVRVPLEF